MLRLYPARTSEEIEHARILFLEYSAAIGVPLGVDRFDDEVATLPGEYAPPRGRLLLAEWDGELAGCIALHPLRDRRDGHEACELKRLYVRDALRGRGIARALTNWAIDEARAMGHERVLVDTLARLPAAVALYRALGFVEVAAYRDSPVPDTIYFELALSTRAR
jgi:GNAT superfamily N-acetyltransferase